MWWSQEIFLLQSRKELKARKWHLFRQKPEKTLPWCKGWPYVSSRCRLAPKQASASRQREETAFVPQACITAKNRKNSWRPIFYSVNAKPRRGLILNNPRLRERSDRSLGYNVNARNPRPASKRLNSGTRRKHMLSCTPCFFYITNFKETTLTMCL